MRNCNDNTRFIKLLNGWLTNSHLIKFDLIQLKSGRSTSRTKLNVKKNLGSKIGTLVAAEVNRL